MRVQESSAVLQIRNNLTAGLDRKMEEKMAFGKSVRLSLTRLLPSDT